MAAASAAAAAIAQAIKASGVLVKLEPEEFQRILYAMKDGLVVFSAPATFSPGHKYLTSYKGLAFYTKSKSAIHLPANFDVITAAKIWIP